MLPSAKSFVQKSLIPALQGPVPSSPTIRTSFLIASVGRSRNLFRMASMKGANRLRVALEEGKGPSLGCWQMIPGSNVSRTLARTGVDWVVVDCEHGNIDGM